MPRLNLLPTPATSTKIQGKDDSPLSATGRTFVLGSPAIAPKHANGNSASSKEPQSATSTSFTLPPPPTRSRTIIQMKPKPQPSADVAKSSPQRGPKSIGKKGGASSGTINGTGKKQPSSTSVAGKKIARKTAHSVIERRRRSKMNEEFSTLKGMVPACTDQEMHKLAILQASIDYLRYLENCITDLKAANNSLSTPLIQPQAPPRRQNDAMLGEDEGDEEGEEEEEEEDVAMGNTAANMNPSSTYPAANQTHSYKSPESITPSPALEYQSHYQASSYASSVSTLPSPAFEPQGNAGNGSRWRFSPSTSTSPTIMPNPEQDQEATAALLMLNKERRNPKFRRAMCVKDLLSS